MNKGIYVSRVQVRAAKAYIALAESRGREIPPAVRAIAEAKEKEPVTIHVLTDSYTILCDACGMAWGCSSEAEFAWIRERHPDVCDPRPDLDAS